MIPIKIMLHVTGIKYCY